MSRIFFHVQYLKGLGHLQRARLIAEAVAGAGHQVDMVSGGLPLADFAPQGVTLHQLPALQAGPGGFRDLRDSEGRRVDEYWLQQRRDALLALFLEAKPDILLIESFPFGRRQLGFELRPLLDAASAAAKRPAVVGSIRDILQIKTRPERNAETVSLLRTFFDTVLVHGDPAFARLDDSFSETPAIRNMIRYTGLVAAPASDFAPGPDTPRNEVVVSAGSGAIGRRMLQAALEARPLTTLADAPWRLLTGPHLPEPDFAALCAEAPGGVVVERFRDDFRRLLAAARLSISFAGYNTACDLLRARVPSVLVAFSDDGGETEQPARARHFAERGLGVMLSDTEVTGVRLAAAVDDAARKPPPKAQSVDLEGAEKSAALLGDASLICSRSP